MARIALLVHLEKSGQANQKVVNAHHLLNGMDLHVPGSNPVLLGKSGMFLPLAVNALKLLTGMGPNADHSPNVSRDKS